MFKSIAFNLSLQLFQTVGMIISIVLWAYGFNNYAIGLYIITLIIYILLAYDFLLNILSPKEILAYTLLSQCYAFVMVFPFSWYLLILSAVLSVFITAIITFIKIRFFLRSDI